MTDSLHRLMPVGFYYKTFIRPRFAWTVAERVIRRATGLGALARDHGRDEATVVRHEHADVLVDRGRRRRAGSRARRRPRTGSVLVCDEGRIGRGVAPGPTLDRDPARSKLRCARSMR